MKTIGGPKMVKSTMLIDTEISFPLSVFLHTASTTLHRLSSLLVALARHVHGIMILNAFKRPFRKRFFTLLYLSFKYFTEVHIPSTENPGPI